MSSGSSRADRLVDPTRSQNITVICRRCASSAAGREAGGLVAAQPSDRRSREEAYGGAKRDLEFPKVLFREIGKDSQVDRVCSDRSAYSCSPSALTNHQLSLP